MVQGSVDGNKDSPAAGLGLAELVAERICHDLAGPAGTLIALAELVGDGADAETISDLRQATRVLARRLELMRQVFGRGADRLAAEDFSTLITEAGLLRRARLDLDGLAPAGTLPAAQARVLLAVLLLGAEVCRAGATVVAAAQPDGAVLVLLTDPADSWPAALAAGIAGRAVEPGPRTALAQVTLRAARAAGVPLDLLMGGGSALLVGRPG